MSTIRKATEKARRENAQRRTGRQEAASLPTLRPVPDPRRDEERQADTSKQSEAAPAPPRAERAETPALELPDGRFGPPDEHLISLLSPDSMVSEHYQTILFTLAQQRQTDGATVVAVSSASAQEGKSVTTLNLAGGLARTENTKVLVMDGDLRKPSIASYLRMKSPGSGLSGALVREGCHLTDVTRFHRPHNLAILPAGNPSNVPYELCSSPRLPALLEEARQHFDYVFIDLPPILFPECRVMEQYVDGLVIVVSAHQTSRTHLRHALEHIDGSKILGLVFNMDTQRSSRIPSYYKYGYTRS